MGNQYTLVTGGSMGIGKALAIECASRNHNILLVALDDAELEKTVSEIASQFKVDVKYLGIDLSEEDSPKKVFDWCVTNSYQVNFLINNAGIGGTSVFEDSELGYSDVRMLVNVRALVLLTRLFIPMLKNNQKSYILNLGSLSAFYAIPYKAVYSASKTFVLQFSKAIRLELMNSNISVSVVCPNGVETNTGTSSRIKAHGLMGKLTQISAMELAQTTIQKVYEEEAIIIPKFINKVLLFIQKLTPSVLEQKILQRQFANEIKKTE